MKNFAKKLSLGIISIFTIAVLMQSCGKVTDVVDGVDVFVDSDILYNPLAVQFINANDGLSGNLPSNMTITVTGPDADKIFTAMGSKDLNPDGNLLSIGIRKVETATEEAPLEFTVHATADNFRDISETFVLTNLEEYELVQVKMYEPAAPPMGVAVESGNFLTAPTGTLEDNTFEFGQGDENAGTMKIELTEGTQLLDHQGEALDGEVEIRLVHTTASTREASLAIAGGTEVELAIDADGNQLEPGAFEVSAYYDLSMTVGGTEVEYFSNPIAMRIELNEESINLDTEEPIQEGEMIPIWSFDHHAEVWKEETMAIIERNDDGKLEAVFEQDHLSHWWGGRYRRWSWWNNRRCTSNIYISSNIAQDDPQHYFSYELVRNRPSGESVFSSGIRKLYSGERVYNRRLYKSYANNGPWFVRVFDDEGNQVAQSNSVGSICGSVTFDLNLSYPSQTMIDVKVSGICPGDDIDLQVIPVAIPLYYRESNNPNFSDYKILGVLRSGEAPDEDGKLVPIGAGATGSLTLGKTYDFMVNQGRDLTLELTGLTLEENFTYVVQSTVYPDLDGYSLDIPAAEASSNPNFSQVLPLNFIELPLTESACEIWSDNF